jgi:hypothetical protein
MHEALGLTASTKKKGKEGRKEESTDRLLKGGLSWSTSLATLLHSHRESNANCDDFHVTSGPLDFWGHLPNACLLVNKHHTRAFAHDGWLRS